VRLPEDAARTSYLANFHMAQALIYETTERILKTHRGVQTEFARLTRPDPGIDKELRAVLSRSYDFKAFADYFSGPVASISSEQAAEAVATARRFVAFFAGILSSSAEDR
jgi:uncharacterized protein (UPF0332 family)